MLCAFWPRVIQGYDPTHLCLSLSFSLWVSVSASLHGCLSLVSVWGSLPLEGSHHGTSQPPSRGEQCVTTVVRSPANVSARINCKTQALREQAFSWWEPHPSSSSWGPDIMEQWWADFIAPHQTFWLTETVEDNKGWLCFLEDNSG